MFLVQSNGTEVRIDPVSTTENPAKIPQNGSRMGNQSNPHKFCNRTHHPDKAKGDASWGPRKQLRNRRKPIWMKSLVLLNPVESFWRASPSNVCGLILNFIYSASSPSPDNTFQYAFCLCKSNEPSELRYAVTILDSLVKEGYGHQVDCMYGAATALYLLQEYAESRARCEQILRSKPESRGAAELHLACIEAAEQKERDQLKKAAVGGTAAVVGAIGLAVVSSILARR
eukprot:scaffold421189_cov48-Attheya_sp.AAC.3